MISWHHCSFLIPNWYPSSIRSSSTIIIIFVVVIGFFIPGSRRKRCRIGRHNRDQQRRGRRQRQTNEDRQLQERCWQRDGQRDHQIPAVSSPTGRLGEITGRRRQRHGSTSTEESFLLIIFIQTHTYTVYITFSLPRTDLNPPLDDHTIAHQAA